MGGIFRDATLQDKVADFSYQNDALAEMIVEAWIDPTFETEVATRLANGSSPKAKAELEARGFYFSNPVVVTETEYNNGFHLTDPQTGIVFVIPDRSRVGTPPKHQSLLDTARMLMAITPNGI